MIDFALGIVVGVVILVIGALPLHIAIKILGGRTTIFKTVVVSVITGILLSFIGMMIEGFGGALVSSLAHSGVLGSGLERQLSLYTSSGYMIFGMPFLVFVGKALGFLVKLVIYAKSFRLSVVKALVLLGIHFLISFVITLVAAMLGIAVGG
ncbi:hypothetical protein COY95_05275 [Candidatus Woesearchaeota archaeon CG_4_10_14_0_8_um_filter_47_5]|nr:MAG: hypothetical protein COY95_05275 [Candidatus Woesearchaeota archaeon CG_4_10_14_0_8_um_filter_47_5]